MASETEEDPHFIDWDVKAEAVLLQLLKDYKPVGVNRHFMMACIHNRMCEILGRQITSKPIWKYLDTVYNMAALDESAIIPFPNEQGNFQLGEEYEDLFFEHLGIPLFQKEKFDGGKMGPSKMKQATSPVSSGKVNGSSGKVSSSISTPSLKANKKVKNDSDGEMEINLVKMDYPVPRENIKGKCLSMPEVKAKVEVQSNVQGKIQTVSNLEVKKMKVDTPSKKVMKKKAEFVESDEKNKDLSSSRKGKQIVNPKSSRNRRSGKIESTPLKRKFEGTSPEKNSDKSESELQKSIRASKMSKTSLEKVSWGCSFL